MSSKVFLSCLIAVVIVTAGLAAPMVASARDVERDTSVDVVFASSEDGYARDVATETVDILTNVGRLRAPTLHEELGAENFLAAIRGSQADVLVILGHGNVDGLAVGSTLIAWPTVRAALAESGAEDIVIGACDSATIGDVPGKRILTVFSGEVDRRVIAPQIANDLFATRLSALDAEFEPRFLEYINAHGGLTHYATLMLMPEEVMQNAEAERCVGKLGDWYEGQATSSQGECIFFMDGADLNCHAGGARQTSPCNGFTSSEQDALNRDSVAAASANEGDAGAGTQATAFSSGWWGVMQTTFGAEVERDGSVVEASAGPDLASGCVTVVRYEDIQAGGLTFAMKAFVKRLREAFSTKDDPVEGSVDGSILALRVCGEVESRSLQSTGTEISMSAAGQVDARVVTYFEADVKVWRWSVSVSVEGGVVFPIKVQIEGRITDCRDGNLRNLTWHLRSPVQFGPAALFMSAQAGWTSLGGKYDLGGKRDFVIDTLHRCPNGWSPYAAANVQLLPATLTRLIDAGLAQENLEPTKLVDDGIRTSFVESAFITIEPGTMTYKGYEEAGVLEKLGVTSILPDQVLLIDVTDPRVLAAIGSEATDPPTPRVSLVNGVALLPRSVETSAAVEAFCQEDLTDGLGILHAKACAGVGSGTVPLPYAVGSATVGLPQPGAPPVDPTVFHAAANDAYTSACPLSSLGCFYASREANALSAAPGPVDLLLTIHDSAQTLTRGAKVQWVLSNCGSTDSATVDTAGEQQLPGGVILGPDGNLMLGGTTRTATCLLPGDSPIAWLSAKEVVADVLDGNTMIARYAADAEGRHASGRGDPGSEPPPDIVGELDPAIEIAEDLACNDLDLC